MLPAIARREHRLGGAGDVLEEHVPVADQRGQDELDLLALPVDDGLDVVEEPRRDLAGALDARSLHLPIVVRERPLHRHDGIDGPARLVGTPPPRSSSTFARRKR
jgi:hypothetical protein